MKDWFYLPGSEVVTRSGLMPKSRIAMAIRNGFKTIPELEKHLSITVAADEKDDVEYLIRIYAPTSYDNLSGCSGCDGCCGKPDSSD